MDLLKGMLYSNVFKAVIQSRIEICLSLSQLSNILSQILSFTMKKNKLVNLQLQAHVSLAFLQFFVFYSVYSFNVN